eukprot:7189536-Pyramimonas_sp.AAC.1
MKQHRLYAEELVNASKAPPPRKCDGGKRRPPRPAGWGASCHVRAQWPARPGRGYFSSSSSASERGGPSGITSVSPPAAGCAR